MKTLTLLTLLLTTSSQAQNLSTYDRVFPKDGNDYSIHAVATLAEMGAGFIAFIATQSGAEKTKEFWARVLPEDNLLIENQKNEINRLANQRSTKVSYELEETINRAKADLATLEHSMDLKKLEKLNVMGLETTSIRQSVRKIKIYGFIRKGVLIYLAVDSITRLVVAMSDRNPGVFAAPKLIPIAFSDIKSMFN